MCSIHIHQINYMYKNIKKIRYCYASFLFIFIQKTKKSTHLKSITLTKYNVDFKLNIYFINKALSFSKVCNLYCKPDLCCIFTDVFVLIGPLCLGQQKRQVYIFFMLSYIETIQTRKETKLHCFRN